MGLLIIQLNRVAVAAVLGVLMTGILSSNVRAVVVAFSDNPENSQAVPDDHNRFFADAGWTVTTDLMASDGNKFAGMTLDPVNDGTESVGTIWALNIAEYETGGVNSNGGTGLGKELENGDVIRFSLWMATDPSDPLLNEGLWTDTYKFELTKAGPGGGSGGEVLDTGEDPPGLANDFTAGNCSIAGGEASCTAHVSPEIVSTGWTQFTMQYEIDDFDFKDASATVDDVVQMRAVMFLGDFQSAEAIQGTFYIDNMMVEIFDDIAMANATPPDATYPGGHIPVVGVAGDFDSDGDVDGADFLKWQQDGLSAADLTDWENNFGAGTLASLGAVPEPSTALLSLLAASAFGLTRRKYCSQVS